MLMAWLQGEAEDVAKHWKDVQSPLDIRQHCRREILNYERGLALLQKELGNEDGANPEPDTVS